MEVCWSSRVRCVSCGHYLEGMLLWVGMYLRGVIVIVA